MNRQRIKNTYSIEEVSEIARVNSFTLRNWEDRYQLFNPERDANGRRIFNEVETIRAIAAAQLVEKEFKIGKIAQSLMKVTDPTAILNEYLQGDYFLDLRKRSIDFLFKFDEISFRTQFDLLIANFSLEFLCDHFFYPIFRQIEELSANQTITVFQEQFAHFHLRSKLHRLIGVAHLNRIKGYDRRVLIAGLPGNKLEDSSLLLYLLLESNDWNVFYGGMELAISDLNAAQKSTNADLIILLGNAVTTQDFRRFVPELEKVSAPIVLGGKLALKLLTEGYQGTPGLELSPWRPGPIARILRYKLNPNKQDTALAHEESKLF